MSHKFSLHILCNDQRTRHKMTSIVDRIRSNDPELKELRLAEFHQVYGANVSDMVEAFHSNTIVEYIRCDRDFLPSMEADECANFFEAVAAVPSLKEAQIWHASLPIKVLTIFVGQAQQLENLQLGCLDLEGTEEDFAAFAAALKGHPSLRSFCMSDFSLNDNSVSIDGLVEVLSTLPKLQFVKLEVTHSRRTSLVGLENASKQVRVSLSGRSLAMLICTSSALKTLHLGRLDLKLDDITALAQAIEQAPALTHLSLPKCGITDETCSILSGAIGKNKTLEQVDLSCNRISDEGCILLATALKDNKTVKFLRLWGNIKISNAGFDALGEIMRSNSCVLERIPLMTPYRIISSSVEEVPAHAA
jgi:Ran GTPase-activating protein (RanGAP) involved in mRNA processing and transport